MNGRDASPDTLKMPGRRGHGKLIGLWLLFIPLLMSATVGALEVLPGYHGSSEEMAGELSAAWKTPIVYGIDHLLFVLALLLIVCGETITGTSADTSSESDHAGVLAGPSGGVLPCAGRIFSAETIRDIIAHHDGSPWQDRSSRMVRLVKAIMAFTLAHSFTLGLATFGGVNVPSAPTEAVIALSIAFVAAELVHQRRGRNGITVRAPWIVAFGFGLLYGIGVSGALRDAGLSQGHIPLALMCFNIGIAVGQLFLVAGVLALAGLLSRVRIGLPRWMEFVPPYVIGMAAMFWVFQRIAAF